MPELPEVEVVRTELKKTILNKKIINYKLNVIKSLKFCEEKELERLKNQKILNILRFGKYLVFEFDLFYLVLHLRMEGKFLFLNENEVEKYINHNIMYFAFEDNKYLLFNDFRKFATIEFFEKKLSISEIANIKGVGKEPWDLDVNDFYNKIKNKRTPIKTTLLDQKYLSGLGNIYVDEVLFACRISPLRKTNEITKKECHMIIKHSIDILRSAIEHKGTTIKTFSYSREGIGSYQNKLKVHMKEGQLCPDNTKIIKTKVGGRGTYYCPSIQK